jgi:hypothetical protein
MRFPCSVCVCVSVNLPVHSQMPELVLMKHGIYVYRGSWACLNGLLHRSLSSVLVFVRVSPRIVARQRLRRHDPVAKNTRNNRRIIGVVVFYTGPVVPKESLWVCLCVPLSLLWLRKHVPLQRRIVGGVVLYAVHMVSKESRRLALPRTSCLISVSI